MVAKVHRDPFKTKTGKTKLGPLSLSQLKSLLETCKKKDKNKVQRRILDIEKISNIKKS